MIQLKFQALYFEQNDAAICGHLGHLNIFRVDSAIVLLAHKNSTNDHRQQCDHLGNSFHRFAIKVNRTESSDLLHFSHCVAFRLCPFLARHTCCHFCPPTQHTNKKDGFAQFILNGPGFVS